MFGNGINYAIKRHAERTFPKECCGIVADRTYVPLINSHEDPENHFRIEPSDHIGLIFGSQMQAVIHSHTNGRDFPSVQDMESQMKAAIPWGIVVCNRYGSGTPFWFGDTVPMLPLIERPFRHGVTDCYALVRDWFRVHRQIILPNMARDWEWWDKEENILVKYFEEFGFVEIDREDLQWGDCVMGCVGAIGSTVTNHCGVYLGDNQIFHHLPKRPSRIDMLGPWSKIITHYCRYKG